MRKFVQKVAAIALLLCLTFTSVAVTMELSQVYASEQDICIYGVDEPGDWKDG